MFLVGVVELAVESGQITQFFDVFGFEDDAGSDVEAFMDTLWGDFRGAVGFINVPEAFSSGISFVEINDF